MGKRSPKENTVGKGEIACYDQFLLFSVFSKGLYCRHVKNMVCLGKGKNHSFKFIIKNVYLSFL